MLKRFRVVLSLLLIFGFSTTLLAQEGDVYFPHVPGSYWVYADQDGNESTRRAVAEKND